MTTRRADILDYEEPQRYDAICAHSFFGRFDATERARLMAAWRRLLRPGGVAVAVNRVRANAGAGRLGFGPGHAQAFRANVERRAQAAGNGIDVSPGELGRLAQEYAARHLVHPVHSADEMRRMFEDGGLCVEGLDEVGVAKAVEGGVSGPTTLEGARYACLVARRRR